MKKAQSLSFNTIIIAVLGLTVMVVLFFVFGGNIGKASDNIGACQAKGGECLPKCEGDKPIAILVNDDSEKCKASGGKCCLPIGLSAG